MPTWARLITFESIVGKSSMSLGRCRAARAGRVGLPPVLLEPGLSSLGGFAVASVKTAQVKMVKPSQSTRQYNHEDVRKQVIANPPTQNIPNISCRSSSDGDWWTSDPYDAANDDAR